jgi:uncharacterized membrane protein
MASKQPARQGTPGAAAQPASRSTAGGKAAPRAKAAPAAKAAAPGKAAPGGKAARPNARPAGTRPGASASGRAVPAKTPRTKAPTATLQKAGVSEPAPAGWRRLIRPAASGTSFAGTRVLAGWRRLIRWAGGGLPFATLVLSLLGLADATYLTIQHFTEASFAYCPGNAAFNCTKVTTSAQSHVFGIPVAVLGLAFFVFMVAATSPWAWRARWPAVHWARLAAVLAGIGFVLYLIYAELFQIGAICLYCTGVHVLTFGLFALIVASAAVHGVRGIGVTGRKG